MPRNQLEHRPGPELDHDHDFEDSMSKTEKNIAEFAERMSENHPEMAQALSKAYEGSITYRETPWLDPEREASEHNGAKMLTALRDVSKNDEGYTPEATSLRMMAIITGPLETGVQELRIALTEAANGPMDEWDKRQFKTFDGERETGARLIRQLEGECLPGPERCLKNAIWSCKDGLPQYMQGLDDEALVKEAQMMAGLANDLRLLGSGQVDPTQFGKSLEQRDPALLAKIEASGSFTQEWMESFKDAPIQEEIRTIFDCFQEAYGQLSDKTRGEAAYETAVAVQHWISTGITEGNETMNDSLAERREALAGAERGSAGDPPENIALDLLQGLRDKDPAGFKETMLALEQSPEQGSANEQSEDLTVIFLKYCRDTDPEEFKEAMLALEQNPEQGAEQETARERPESTTVKFINSLRDNDPAGFEDTVLEHAQRWVPDRGG